VGWERLSSHYLAPSFGGNSRGSAPAAIRIMLDLDSLVLSGSHDLNETIHLPTFHEHSTVPPEPNRPNAAQLNRQIRRE
jgi:hypothetical protein